MNRLKSCVVSASCLLVAVFAGPARGELSTLQTGAATGAPDVAAVLGQVAALRGEPSTVSAAGITRADTRLVTIENAGAFEDSAKRRLVIVGGIDGDERGAKAVVDAVRWFKTAAPAAVRHKWIVSALPLANPDRQRAPFRFPVEKGFFDDPDQPESRYLWRWIVYQAPDAVVVVTADQNPSADTLIAALRLGRWSGGLGAVPATGAAVTGLNHMLTTLLAAPSGRSPLHEALLRRASREPLDVARTLARKYPQQVVASYIPSVAWTNMLRLSQVTGEPEWAAKARDQTAPWVSGEKKMLTDRTPLTSIAGYMIFPELARAGGDGNLQPLIDEGVALAGATKNENEYANGSGWTDDMFMATSVLARAGKHDLAARMLQAYAARLQRTDGIFSHGPDAPHAWGRGNGFAALGLMEALTAIPESHPVRAAIGDIAKRQMSGLEPNQAPDGMFREVIDEPGSYREETATAMLLSALGRGIRHGWFEKTRLPIVERAWRGLAAHIADDGALVDVCASTGAGQTKRYYLDRPAISGFDDRGGAMALLAAMEVDALRKANPPKPKPPRSGSGKPAVHRGTSSPP